MKKERCDKCAGESVNAVKIRESKNNSTVEF